MTLSTNAPLKREIPASQTRKLNQQCQEHAGNTSSISRARERQLIVNFLLSLSRYWKRKAIAANRLAKMPAID